MALTNISSMLQLMQEEIMKSQKSNEILNMTVGDIIKMYYGPENVDSIVNEVQKAQDSGKSGIQLEEHMKEVMAKYEVNVTPGNEQSKGAGTSVVVLGVVFGSSQPLH